MADDKSELKTKLKSAKEAIQQKNYKQALRECEAALKLDPKCYTALVFSGLCHCELNDSIEARKSYELATQLEPKQVLAWQGFVQYHENFSIFDDVYRRCLCTLRDLTTDSIKKLDLTSKLAKLYAKLNKIEEALNECLLLINSATDKKSEYENLSIDCVGNYKLNKTELIEMHDLRHKAFEVAKSLCQKEERPSMELLSLVSQQLVARFIDGSFDDSNDLPILNSVLDRFQTLNDEEDSSSNVYSLLLESVSEQINKNLSEALQILEEIDMDQVETSKEYFALMSLIHSKLNNHNEALKCSEECLGLMAKEISIEFKLRITFIKAESLFWLHESDTKKIPEISSLFEYVIENYSKPNSTMQQRCLLGIARCKFLIADQAAAVSSIERLTPDVDLHLTLAWMHLKLCKFDDAIRFARIAVDEDAENNFCRLMLGKILWLSGEKTVGTMKHFVEAAKLNSNSWESFYYLALCQLEVNKNDERALQCLERANILTDNRNESVGRALSDLYRKLKMEDKYLTFLIEVTHKISPDVGFWAWFRLGVELAVKNRADDAISTFQTLLRSHPNSIRCWECLADAYYTRGSYSSSLKTFEKISELEPSSMYASYRIACIKLTLNFDDEATSKFEEILNNFDNVYVPAMLGLAESLYKGSNLHFSQARYYRALDLRRRCIVVLTDCLKLNSALCSTWKLLGDVLTSLNDFADDSLTDFDEILNDIFRANVTTGEGTSTKLNLLRFGAQSYLRAIKFRPNFAHLWHDLALNFYFQTKIDATNLPKALECAKQAVRLNSNMSKFWSTLGYVAASTSSSLVSPGFVQHCFVKSLNIDAQNVCAWTNLGLFYLTHNENATLAHECFKRAQSVDPDYVNVWIGQALIAEKFSPQEAMDLFRHCSELGNHPEGLSGYAYHVLCMILDAQADRKSAGYLYAIEHLFAVPMARDGLIKYCALRPDDACILNLLGILSELESLIKVANDYYHNALRIANDCNLGNDVINALNSNLCRVSSKLKNHYVFEKNSVGLHKTTFADYCSNALSLCRLNLYTESFSAYQESFRLASSAEEKFYVKLAQCIIVLNQSGVDEAMKFYDNNCKTVQLPQSSLMSTILSLKKQLVDEKLIRDAFAKIWSAGCFDLQTLVVSFLAISKLNVGVKLASWIVHKCPHLISAWFILKQSSSIKNVQRLLEIKSNDSMVKFYNKLRSIY